MYSIYDGKRKVDNTMSDQIEREQQIEEESLTKNSLQIQKAAWIREELEKRRAQEDQLLQQILREQQMLQELDEHGSEYGACKRGAEIPGRYKSACGRPRV